MNNGPHMILGKKEAFIISDRENSNEYSKIHHDYLYALNRDDFKKKQWYSVFYM